MHTFLSSISFYLISGNVVRVDIAEDSEKKSKGFGVVVFETPAEAVQAVCIFSVIYLFVYNGRSPEGITIFQGIRYCKLIFANLFPVQNNFVTVPRLICVRRVAVNN